MKTYPYTNEQLRVDELALDPTLNRTIIMPHLNAMQTDFQPNAIRQVVASKRKDGAIVILDGQHEVELVHTLKGPNASIEVKVLHGMSFEDESELVLYLNNTKIYGQRWKYRNSLNAGEQWAQDVRDLFEDLSLPVPTWCMGAVKTVYEYGTLPDTITLLHHTYGIIRKAYAASMIKGVGEFLYHYQAYNIDGNKIIRMLSRYTPSQFNLEGRDLADTDNVGIAKLLLKKYNYRSTNPLPGWDEA